MSKNKVKGTIAVFGIIACGIYSVLSGDNEKNETHNEDVIISESSESFSGIELFSKKMDESHDLISYETAENLYNFLHQELLFDDIIFAQKNAVGDILFDIVADDYSLMISVDNDGIYSVRCGSYDLYDGENILITKNGLDDRSIDHESEYYSIAKEIILNNLKSPKSAEFSSLWSDEVKMQRNKDMVIVQGYVDAENSFGVSTRNQWQVEFKVLDLDTFSYEIIYIFIDGNKFGEFIKLD